MQSVLRSSRCTSGPAGPGPGSISGAAPRRTVCVRASKEDPFAEKTKYNDSIIDRLFITLFTTKIADQLAPNKPYVPSLAQYDDFVRVSNDIMKGRTTAEAHAVVQKTLTSLVPPGLPALLKNSFRPTKTVAELNAFFASLGFSWLVGESELKDATITLDDGSTRVQKSTVLIKKCRYLEQSGCVGMCFNLCKVPTQDFFTNDIGLPLTMNPNFEDLSCEMIFGQVPPPRELDPAYQQPCFATQCAIAGRLPTNPTPCPKIDTDRAKKPAVQPGSTTAAALSTTTTTTTA